MPPHWTKYAISQDSTHHLAGGRPAYAARFWEVLKFHAPGLAAVLDESGGYHISPDGEPAYSARFVRTFGFYDGRAAAESADGWLHIPPDGVPLYAERYDWGGNFQGGLCPVRERGGGGYFHINLDGRAAYPERHAYAGDFRDGFAVVQDADGLHTHIDASGARPHGRRFLDLDVFHKGNARARDAGGWHHVNMDGAPLYAARFAQVEPFYNGQARAEEFDGALAVIDESGERIRTLRRPLVSPLERLSGEMVGLWRTQTIRSAVELGVFERLPASASEIERDLGLAQSVGERLMRALAEMGLAKRGADGAYSATPTGAHLRRSHPLSLADAALHWGRESYAAWSEITGALKTGRPAFPEIYGAGFFDWLSDKPGKLRSYHAAMSAYARHDYETIAESADFRRHKTILDAGGGNGELAFALLRSCPWLSATVMDLPEVISNAPPPPADIAERCRFIPGDLFEKWPASGSDAIILARVLHDWSDADALRILRRARQAMRADSTLYIVEMLLDEDENPPSGGLLDLHMLTTTGGAERTANQYRALLTQAGLKMTGATPTTAVSSVLSAALR